MSGRRAQSLPPHVMDAKPTRGRCIAAICFSWKVITCIVSHVTLVLLVVSYCVGGAYLFQKLERPHEIEVKTGIQNMRKNLTDKIWKFSDNSTFLSETIWMEGVSPYLAVFENEILTAMKKEGWDGDENVTLSQWTFVGSLFYSIIVITTIGYGHISPHTDWGKVTTIFYAIVGIPLMLLCLSNIGDVMATSFRFLYWRVCCFICTRTSKRPRHRSRQRSVRAHRYSPNSQPPPFRRSMKLTQISAADSGVGPSIGLPHAYSDPELRNIGRSDDYDRDYEIGKHGQRNSPPTPRRVVIPYEEDFHSRYSNHGQNLNRGSRFSGRQRHRSYVRDRHTVERERHFSRSKQQFDSMEEELNIPSTSAKRSLSVRSVRSTNHRREEQREKLSREPHPNPVVLQQPLNRGRSLPNTPRGRAKSVDPRVLANYEEVDEDVIRKTPIISNRYAIDELDCGYYRQKKTSRSQSMPRSAHQKQMYRNGQNPQRSLDVSHINNNPKLHKLAQRPSSLNRHSAPRSRYGNHLELPEFTSQYAQKSPMRTRSPHPDDYDDDLEGSYVKDQEDNEISQSRHRERRQRRDRTERLPPSPRIMSPMGFAVKRQVRRRPSFDRDDDSFGDEWSDYYGDISPKDRPVPIWLCVFLVISYILGGAALFAHWEDWTFLDSAYFCFITLTTIGFGDFVPAKGVKDESEQSIAYCSLYLLFGIALLAMSFNLVQEEFIANVKEVARRLGILKDEEDDD